MNWITFIGFVAATCTTISFLPQVIKSWKTRRTKDISFWMYLLFVFGIFCWLVYGLLRHDAVLVIANAATFMLSGSVFYLKIKNRETS